MPKEEQQRKTADPLQDPLLEKRARGSNHTARVLSPDQ